MSKCATFAVLLPLVAVSLGVLKLSVEAPNLSIPMKSEDKLFAAVQEMQGNASWGSFLGKTSLSAEIVALPLINSISIQMLVLAIIPWNGSLV
jgi:hypothetical protein